MSEKLRKAAKGLLAFYDSAPGKWGAPHKHKIEALRQALQPTDAGGEERELSLTECVAELRRVTVENNVQLPTFDELMRERYGDDPPPDPDPLATAINRYAGPGRDLFEMMLAEIRRR